MSARHPSNPENRITDKLFKGGSVLIPFIEWILNYSKLDAVADLIAGITIGLIIIPQSVAYVAIVGLSAKVGLLSSVIGGLIYTFLGTVKEISIGPTAMMSLMTDQYTNEMLIDNIGTLCFGCAIIGLTLSVLRLAWSRRLMNSYVVDFIMVHNLRTSGVLDSITYLFAYDCIITNIIGTLDKFLFIQLCTPLTTFLDRIVYNGLVVEFISIPVSSAFGSSVALTILASELKNLTGLNYKSNKFIESLEKFGLYIREIKSGDICLGIICIVMLILLDEVKNLPVSSSCKCRESIKKLLWLVAMSRNAITLLTACLLTEYFEKSFGVVPYELTDPVTPGFPDFQVPWRDTRMNNVTVTFQDRVQNLYLGMIITPIVALLVHVSIAKFFDSGNTIRISHELFSMSICNFLCSFFNSSPVAGAFSRSAVSSVCEVRTPISSFYAAVLAFLALTLLTPYFRLIPKASLSAVIVTAVVTVIDYKIVFVLWKNSKKDFTVLVLTLLIGLYLGIELGLIAGVLINLLFLVYLWARPSIEMDKCKSELGDYVLVTPDLGLFYPAVSHLETQMYKTLKKDPYKNLPIAVNCIFFKGFDYTAVKGLTRIINLYQKQKRKIIFFNANERILNMCTEIDENVSAHFCDSAQNFEHCLFSDRSEIKEPAAAEVNGNCSTILIEKLVKEEVPLLNIIKKQSRPNSL